MDEPNVNPYKPPDQSAASLPARTFWGTAFVRGLIATIVGFLLTQATVVAAKWWSLDPFRPGVFSSICKVTTALFIAGIISTAIAATGWSLSRLLGTVSRARMN